MSEKSSSHSLGFGRDSSIRLVERHKTPWSVLSRISFEEMATHLECPAGTCKSGYHRALMELSSLLDADNDSGGVSRVRDEDSHNSESLEEDREKELQAQASYQKELERWFEMRGLPKTVTENVIRDVILDSFEKGSRFQTYPFGLFFELRDCVQKRLRDMATNG